MNQPRRWTVLTITVLAIISTLAAGGCSSGSSNNSPTAPSLLDLQAFETAAQTAEGGSRVQLRMRVLQGLSELRQGSQTGSARAQICLSGRCVEGAITPDFMEASCAGQFNSAFAETEIGFGTGWLNNEVVGVDFCVSELAEGVTFETTVMNGVARSNTVRTRCGMSGGILICASD